jgi:hypothetical protein
MAGSHSFTFLLPWTTGPDGLWVFGKFLGLWTWSAMDRKNGPLQKGKKKKKKMKLIEPAHNICFAIIFFYMKVVSS